MTTGIALLSAGFGVPSLRVGVEEIAAAWGGGGRGQVAVCDADEDSLTLAWQAASDALVAAGIDAGALSGLWWGTARPPMAEGPSHAFLATALGLEPETGGALFSGSPHAGMEALVAAWDAIAAGHASVALVVASDALLPGIGTATETECGAGAAALVLSASTAAAAPARLVARATVSMPVIDRYRGDRQEATAEVYDGRLFREEVFLPLLTQVGENLKEAAPAAGVASVARWAASDPDGKLGSGLVRRLGGELSSATVRSALGDTGCAAPLLGLVAALESASSGDPGSASTNDPPASDESDSSPLGVGLIGYGGGRASAVAVEVTGPVPGTYGFGEKLALGRRVGYVESLNVRGQLQPMTDPIPMGVPPGSAAFVRGNVEMLRLEGAKCSACGTVSVPPSIHPTCTGCGGTELKVVALARSGRVQTFVVNQTMPAPFQAPLPLVVIDLDDGARLMLQGSPADSEQLSIDTPVELKLRRYAVERGVPVYGYKAFATSSRSTSGPGDLSASDQGSGATVNGSARRSGKLGATAK